MLNISVVCQAKTEKELTGQQLYYRNSVGGRCQLVYLKQVTIYRVGHWTHKYFENILEKVSNKSCMVLKGQHRGDLDHGLEFYVQTWPWLFRNFEDQMNIFKSEYELGPGPLAQLISGQLSTDHFNQCFQNLRTLGFVWK